MFQVGFSFNLILLQKLSVNISMGSRNLEADLFFNQLQKAQTTDAQFKSFFIEIQNIWAWADKLGR